MRKHTEFANIPVTQANAKLDAGILTLTPVTTPLLTDG